MLNEIKKQLEEATKKYAELEAKRENAQEEFYSEIRLFNSKMAEYVKDEILFSFDFLKIGVSLNSKDELDIVVDADRDDLPLKFDYRIKFENEDVSISSNSWSGLKCTTENDAWTLVNETHAIHKIVRTDWNTCIKNFLSVVSIPTYEFSNEDQDAVYELNSNIRKLKEKLFDMELDNAIKNQSWIRVCYDPTHNRHKKNSFIRILGETSKYYDFEWMDDGHVWNRERKSKEYVLKALCNKVEIKED